MIRRWAQLIRLQPLLLLLSLYLAGCTSGGDQGQATAPAPSPQVERQALDNLLTLYQEAVVAEDSDRLLALLAPATALAQAQTTAPCARTRRLLDSPTALRDTLRATFQQATVTALAIPPETVEVAPTRAALPPGSQKYPGAADGDAAHASVSHHLGAQPRGHGGGRVGISAVRAGRWSR